MLQNSSSRDRALFICLSLVVIVASFFWRVRSHDFIELDDDYLIYNNTKYIPVTTEGLKELWTAPFAQIYMPLTYTAWAGLSLVAQGEPSPGEKPPSEVTRRYDPSVFHSFSLLLHVLNCLIAFALLRILVRNDKAAAIGAALWALHPYQVESVAWASELKGLLSGFFVLLALWFYAANLSQASPDENPKPKSSDGEAEEGPIPEDEQSHSALLTADTSEGQHKTRFLPSPGLYAGATFFFVLALFSKPSAACAPILAFLIDCWIRRSPRQAALRLAPWVLLCIPIFLMAKQGQPMQEALAPAWSRPLVMLDAIAFYLGKLFLPFQLRLEYTRTPGWVLKQGYLYWTWILPVALLALLWWKRRQWSGLLLGLGLFVAAVLPVSGLIPFVFQYYSTVADRYMYLPLIGAAFALAWVIATHPSRTKWIAGGAIVAGLAVLNWIQLGYWSSQTELYKHTLAINPRSWQSRVNLSNLYNRAGKKTEAANLLRDAHNIYPEYAEPFINIGYILLQSNRPAEAINYLIRAVELSPQSLVAYRNLADSYIALKKYDFALLAARRADQLDPNLVDIKLRLLKIYVYQGKLKEVEKTLGEARKLFPTPEAYYVVIGREFSQMDRPALALPFYLNAVKLLPYDPSLHSDIGVILLRLNQPGPAAKALANAVQLQPNDGYVRLNYALALKANKQIPQAIKELEEAVRLEPGLQVAHQQLELLGRGSQAQNTGGR